MVQSKAGAALKSWLRDFLSSCLRRLKIPKIWRRALVVAIPKPMKPVGDPKSYRPISLLCVPYKILERLIYARVASILNNKSHLSSLISKTQRQLVLLLLPFSNPVFNNTQTFQHFVILFMWRRRNKRKLN